jgi:catechol 2,3-dioxygenase-like lactoylglutathione lyase family enzyme
MTSILTRGVHHVGLAVPDLEAAQRFFTEALGWRLEGKDSEYPAAFVSDGTTMLTLWRVADPDTAIAFDRRSNVGLHHLALTVVDEAALMELHARVRAHPGVEIETEPALMHASATPCHFCTMPGGLRIEFATPFA